MSDILLEQLKKHLEETPKEVLEQEFFEIDCETNGIDPKAPDARKQLKKLHRRNKLKYKIWPTIRNTTCWMLSLYYTFIAGVEFSTDSHHWIWVVIYLIISLGWLHLFLQYKFGDDYLNN
jgi:hypothetical protein